MARSKNVTKFYNHFCIGRGWYKRTVLFVNETTFQFPCIIRVYKLVYNYFTTIINIVCEEITDYFRFNATASEPLCVVGCYHDVISLEVCQRDGRQRCFRVYLGFYIIIRIQYSFQVGNIVIRTQDKYIGHCSKLARSFQFYLVGIA